MGAKHCTGCGDLKSFSEFFADRRARDGKKSECKKCHYADRPSRRVPGRKLSRYASLADRLEQGIARVPWSGCWIWMGTSIAYGYGAIQLDKKRILAHRASWMLHRGPIPSGMSVCHKCDVTACINPDHLFLGTNSDNMRDMYAKERRPYALKATEMAEIVRLRRNGERVEAIADQFDVHASTIFKVLRKCA